MYFSGKVPNSILSFLDRKNADLERFYELSDLPVELLKDPTCWLDAKQVEDFLQVIDREFSSLGTDHSLVSTVGYHCHELRSWGVLDSVLKMMTDPQDMFAQPQRILSYFISPAPPVANVQRASNSISFDLPLAPEEYPFFADYLRAAFEALPLYASKELAQVSWSQTKMVISWNRAQSSLFDSDPKDVNLKPELVRGLLKTLEESQVELEKTKRKLMLKEQEVEQLKRTRASMPEKKSAEAMILRNECFRLVDYLGRAQQLVTLLVGQDRMDRQVQEAMRRMDWKQITEAIPAVRRELDRAGTYCRAGAVSRDLPSTVAISPEVKSIPLVNSFGGQNGKVQITGGSRDYRQPREPDPRG